MRKVRADLTRHVGGNPSAVQKMLIDRVARVALRLALYDEKVAAGELTDFDSKVYGALHNSFRLLLRELGIKGVAEKPPSLADHLARKAAEKAAAQAEEPAAA